MPITPIQTSVSPANGTTAVSGDAEITVKILAGDYTVNFALTKITVNGVVAWQNAAAQNGWAGAVTAITDGRVYTLTPPRGFFYGSAVVVQTEVDHEALHASPLYPFLLPAGPPLTVDNLDPLG